MSEPHRERPRDCGTAEQRDELAALYPDHVNSKHLRCQGALKVFIDTFSIFRPVSETPPVRRGAR